MPPKMDKNIRGAAGQFFVAGELSRRGFVAALTMGNCPGTDILVSNRTATRTAHIQVKTFIPGASKCSVGQKAETNYGPNFFWVLAGIPLSSDSPPLYFIIPAEVMAREIRTAHQNWRDTPGKAGQEHNETTFRAVLLPPLKSCLGWSVEEFRNNWGLLENWLNLD